MWEKSICALSKYLPARDCDLLRCERFFSDRRVSIISSSSSVTVAPKSDCCERVSCPLVGPRVQNVHFPFGKVAAINSHPAPALSGGCSIWFRRRLLRNPLSKRFEFKIQWEKNPRAEELDSGSTSLKSKFSMLHLLLLRAANSLDGYVSISSETKSDCGSQRSL